MSPLQNDTQTFIQWLEPDITVVFHEAEWTAKFKDKKEIYL